jgi:long-chain acyl-CoA synthetase
VREPQVMCGYYKRPDESENVLRNGWLYTGDVGIMDEEGYLTVIDRTKDVIIAGGYNIYPTELDSILGTHPRIQEACAVGVPDAYRGETVKAYIVTKRGQPLSEEEVLQFCRENLAPYKVPRIIEFTGELPKSTAVGKVLRKELRKMAAERLSKEAGGLGSIELPTHKEE